MCCRLEAFIELETIFLRRLLAGKMVVKRSKSKYQGLWARKRGQSGGKAPLVLTRAPSVKKAKVKDEISADSGQSAPAPSSSAVSVSPRASNGKKKKKVKRLKRRKKSGRRILRASLDELAAELNQNVRGLFRSDKDARIKDVAPELELLVKADSGKVAAGFTSKAFQREKASFVASMLRNTKPIRILMKATGRFPFHGVMDEDGYVAYESALYRPEGIYFIVVSVAIFYFWIMGSFNLVDVMLNLTFGDGKKRSKECEYERMFEIAIIDRNIIALASLWTALCHTTLASVNLYFNRRYVAKYLSFWSLATQTIHVDVAAGIFKFSVVTVVFYLVIMFLMTIIHLVRLSARSADLPSLFSLMTFRLNFPCLLERNIVVDTAENLEDLENQLRDGFSFTTTYYLLEILSGLCLLFAYISSKVLILYFLHFCRMLTKAFKSWNARFHAVINFPDKFSQSVEGRTTYELLFNDHCTLLSLTEGTDRCFATIVESYLILQLVSIILESYFLYRTIAFSDAQQSHSSEKSNSTIIDMTFTNSPFFIRPYDYVPGAVILLSNVMILIVILREAGKISAVAKEGLEVIRRKTMMGRKSNQELWFTLSMYFSYTSQTQLCLQGSGFFQFNNMFVVTVVAILFSNLVTVIQFAPPMDIDYRGAVYNYMEESDDALRSHIGGFLRDLEKLKDRHWVPGPNEAD